MKNTDSQKTSPWKTGVVIPAVAAIVIGIATSLSNGLQKEFIKGWNWVFEKTVPVKVIVADSIKRVDFVKKAKDDSTRTADSIKKAKIDSIRRAKLIKFANSVLSRLTVSCTIN